MSKPEKKLDLKEAFKEYAKKEMEFYESAEKDKLYHRVIPNLKEKDKGSVDFYYNGVVVGGYIYKDTITLNKLRITKYGTEEGVAKAVKKIEDSIKSVDMTCDNQLKQYNNIIRWMT